MGDLVTELRTAYFASDWLVAKEAADEIERLRARVAQLTNIVRTGNNAIQSAYRQAHAEWQGHDTIEAKHDKIVQDWLANARAALEAGDD